MIFDIHIHTRISPCSILPLEDVLSRARGLGLDGVCVTDHNSMSAARFVREGPQPDGLVILVGMEYDTPEGQFLIFGPFEGLRPGLTGPELLKLVDASGGACVAAHPFRLIRPVSEYLLRDRRCHAIETLNGANHIDENIMAQDAAQRLDKTGTGGSDAHCLEDLGRAASWISMPVSSRLDLIRAIQDGLIKPLGPGS